MSESPDRHREEMLRALGEVQKGLNCRPLFRSPVLIGSTYLSAHQALNREYMDAFVFDFKRYTSRRFAIKHPICKARS